MVRISAILSKGENMKFRIFISMYLQRNNTQRIRGVTKKFQDFDYNASTNKSRLGRFVYMEFSPVCDF